MTLEINPYYFQGPPTTPRILVKFLEHDKAVQALLEGDVDILDWETIGVQDVNEQFLQAMDAGKVKLITLSSPVWEHISFGLFLP